MPGEEVIISPIVSAIGILPSPISNIIAAIVILFVGFIIGKIVGYVVEKLLIEMKVDKYVRAKKAQFKLSHIFAVVFTWVVYLVFIQAATASNVLGVPVVSNFVGQIVAFLPKILGAIAVLGAGYGVGRYVEELIRESRAIYSGLMSRLFFFFIVYVAVAISLELVFGIEHTAFVHQILLILVGSVGLGIAIALGLGLKDMVRDLSRGYGRKLEKELDRLEKNK